jgi:hypothetical protein
MQRVEKYLNLCDPHVVWVFQHSMCSYMIFVLMRERHVWCLYLVSICTTFPKKSIIFFTKCQFVPSISNIRHSVHLSFYRVFVQHKCQGRNTQYTYFVNWVFSFYGVFRIQTLGTHFSTERPFSIWVLEELNILYNIWSMCVNRQTMTLYRVFY